MDLYQTFLTLPAGSSSAEFGAAALGSRRSDFLAKSVDGAPLFLFQDSGETRYVPAISLKHVSVQFQSTCRVKTERGTLEDQFAVVSCNSSEPELHELFVRCFGAAAETLPDTAATNELRLQLQELLELFRGLSRPNGREVSGLWGELFVIFSSKNVSGALKAWRADQFERFDFSWLGRFLEVKTSTQGRIHEFALEQLQSPISGEGFVASMLLQPLSGGLGIMDLAKGIESAVKMEPLLRQKLWSNIAAALGSDFSDQVDRRFDPSYAELNLIVFAVEDIPAPDKPNDGRITNVRFRADLSSVHSSAFGPTNKGLHSVFG